MPLRWAGCGGPPSGKDEVVGVSGGEEGTVGRRANRTFGVDGWESSEESESQSEESDEDDIFGGFFFMCRRRRRRYRTLGGLRVGLSVLSVVTAIGYEGLSTEENPVEGSCSS